MSDELKSHVEVAVQSVRASRGSDKSIQVFSDFISTATKNELGMQELAAVAGSMLIASLVSMIKPNGGSITDATAAALQIVADMAVSPDALIKLWQTS